MMKFWNNLNVRSKAFVSLGVAFFGLLVMTIGSAIELMALIVIGMVITMAGLGVRALCICCPHCGHLLGRDLGEYCPHCGEKLDPSDD